MEQDDMYALLRNTIDSSMDMIQVFKAVRNKDGEVEDFVWILNNRTAEDYYGDVIGKSLLSLNPGVIEAGIFDTFKRVVETGESDQSITNYVYEQFDGWYHQTAVKQGDGITTTTKDITALKKAELELHRLKDEVAQHADNKYRTLFNTIDDGFALMELDRNASGHVVDLIYREVNDRFKDFTGWADAVGKRGTYLMPHLDKSLLELMQSVADTGKTYRREDYVADLDRWYDVHYSCIGEPGSNFIVAVFMETSERKRSERQQRFVLDLSDKIRPLTQVTDILHVFCSEVAAYFEVQHCGYAEVDDLHRDLVTLGAWSFSKFDIAKRAMHLSQLNRSLIESYARGETQCHNNTANSDMPMYTDPDHDILAGISVPLVADHQWFALFYIHSTQARIWRDSEIQFMERLAHRLWDAVERVKAEVALAISQEAYRSELEKDKIRKIEAKQKLEIFRASLRTAEEERHRISESLHNGIGQILYGIKLNMIGLDHSLPEDRFLKNKEFVNKLLTDVIVETRRISHELMPTILEEFGLKTAVSDMCEQLSSDVVFDFKISGQNYQVEKFIELAIFRTTQELVTNVIKHAQAKMCDVRIDITPRSIAISVRDDGQGIMVMEGRQKGIGLSSIRSKVKLLNGEISIKSKRGEGTHIEVHIPRPERSAI